MIIVDVLIRIMQEIISDIVTSMNYRWSNRLTSMVIEKIKKITK